jgi:hypothetical protein
MDNKEIEKLIAEMQPAMRGNIADKSGVARFRVLETDDTTYTLKNMDMQNVMNNLVYVNKRRALRVGQVYRGRVTNTDYGGFPNFTIVE